MLQYQTNKTFTNNINCFNFTVTNKNKISKRFNLTKTFDGKLTSINF